MPLYVDPHPLVAAAAAATFLGYLTFPHHSRSHRSLLLFCIMHGFHASHSCYALTELKSH